MLNGLIEIYSNANYFAEISSLKKELTEMRETGEQLMIAHKHEVCAYVHMCMCMYVITLT